jgi:hypothetical protein
VIYAAIVLAVAFLLFVASRCGKPTPDVVLRQCLDRVVAKDYDSMLKFCTPELRAVYSNSLWVVHAHRTAVAKTEYTIGTVTLPSSESARIDVEMKFSFLNNISAPMTVSLKFDMDDRGKWYVANVWQVEPTGQMSINALSNPPAAAW